MTIIVDSVSKCTILRGAGPHDEALVVQTDLCHRRHDSPVRARSVLYKPKLKIWSPVYQSWICAESVKPCTKRSGTW